MSQEDLVILVGKKYVETTSVIALRADDVPANAGENVLQVEKATLVGPALAAGVARRLLNYHKMRNELSFKMRLGSERLADMAIIENYGGQKVRGCFVSLSIDLTDGNLASAKLVGLRIDTTWQYYCGDELYCGGEGII